MVYNEHGCDLYDYAEHLSAIFEAELENQLHSNSKQANSSETLFCLRDSTSKRVLFYDMEKGQYYLEYFETEDEQVIFDLDKKEANTPAPKRRKMGDNPDPSVMAELAKHERTYAKKDPAVLARVNELVWALYRPRQSNARTVGGERKRRAAAMAGMRNMSTADVDEVPAPASNRRKRARPAVPKRDTAVAAASEPVTPFDAPPTPITPRDSAAAYSYPQSNVQTPATGMGSFAPEDGGFTPRPMTPYTPASGHEEDEYISISPRIEQSGTSTPAPVGLSLSRESTPAQTPFQEAQPIPHYQPAQAPLPAYQQHFAEDDPFAAPVQPIAADFGSVPREPSPAPPAQTTPAAPRQLLKFNLNKFGAALPKPAPTPPPGLNWD